MVKIDDKINIGDNMDSDTMLIMTLLADSFGMVCSFYGWQILPRKREKEAKRQYKFNIDELNKYDGYLINKECFLDNGSLEDKKEAMNKKKLEVLYPYVEALVNQVSEENLKLMYKNLKTLKLEKFSKPLMYFLAGAIGVTGLYSHDKQRIRYAEKDSLGHELLHLCSTYYNKQVGIVECGFAQLKEGNTKKDRVFIGQALTEGYTELLNVRYFKKDKMSYVEYVKIARLFELFFDDSRDMEGFYFHHDLPGFINYMSKFMPYKKVIDVLTTLDKMILYEGYFPDEFFDDYDKLKSELYECFKDANKNPKKLELFEKILDEDSPLNFSLYTSRLSQDAEIVDFNALEEKEEKGIKMA